MLRYGVFATKKAALDFVADDEHPDWYTPVELPVQVDGTAIIEPKNLPKQSMR